MPKVVGEIERILRDQALETRKQLVLHHFLDLHRSLQRSYYLFRYLQLILNTITLILSIIGISLLLCLEYETFTGAIRVIIFWVVWGLMLLVTIVNRIVGDSGMARRQLIARMKMDHLENEAWLFVTQAGHYVARDRSDLYVTFMERIHNIEMEFEEPRRINTNFDGVGSIFSQVI